MTHSLVYLSFALAISFLSICQCDELNYRLPSAVRPLQYVLNIVPYFDGANGKEAFTFDGSVQIKLSTSERNVQHITLHSSGLDVSLNMTITTDPSGKQLEVVGRTVDARTEQIVIHLNDTLDPKLYYHLHMHFKGNLSNDMLGFYRSSYQENGETRWLAATQFQATHARKAFPCFDEPRFKAVFMVSVTRPANYSLSVSNTRIASSRKLFSTDQVIETFKPTPIMSTYLLAFLVSPFSVRENNLNTFEVYSRPQALPQTAFAFEFGQKALAELSAYFKIDYFSIPEIEKMSMAALPDFAAGAMENWGLLTFRETNLLYDEDHSTSLAQQRVAEVVVHEVTHMWFGNLVTCDSWSYTWLNEGFARYFNYFATARLLPDWKFDLQFVPKVLHSALSFDSSGTSEPLSREVNTPDQAESDKITYDKAASVIRMIQHVMGKDEFHLSLIDYLQNNRLNTVVPSQLFAALQNRSAVNVTTLFEAWTTQPGYPLITVTVDEKRQSMTITQKKFTRSGEQREYKNTTWNVPLNIATADDNEDFSNTRTRFVLKQGDIGLNISLPKGIQWIIFNVQQTGFYRVNYDDVTWDHIVKALVQGVIHPLNKAQIVDDSLNLARAGVISYTRAFKNIRFVQNDTDYLAWQSALNNFPFILNRLRANETDDFKKYVRALVETVYNDLGFHPKTNDSRLDIYNRIDIIRTACDYGHTNCIESAQDEYHKALSTTHKIPVDIAATVYCTVISESNDTSEWNSTWHQYSMSNVAAEKAMLLGVLGCTKQPTLIQRYLQVILSDEIRVQDKLSAFGATLRKAENVDVVLDFVLTNHQTIAKALKSQSQFDSLLAMVIGRFTSRAQVDRVDEFVGANKALYGRSASIARANENALHNLQWSEKYSAEISKYVKAFNGNGASSLSGAFIIVALTATFSAFFVH